MPSHSEKQRKFFGLVRAIQKGDKSTKDVSPHLHQVANKISPKAAGEFASNIAELKTIKEVLTILKEIKNTSVLNEVETNSNPVAKQFTVKDNYEKYVKRYIGQPFDQKETEALNNFDKVKPTKVDRIEIRFETTDEFNNSTTTIIKKMKDNGQFSYNGFSKHKSTAPKEEEPEPTESPTDKNPSSPGAPAPTEPPDTNNGQEEKDDIIIYKSVLFNDAIKGAAMLVEFLKKIDL